MEDGHEFWTPQHYSWQYFSDDFRKNLLTQRNINAMQANDVKPLNSTVEEYHKLFGAHIPIFGSCRYVDLNKFLQEFPQLMRKTVLPYSIK